MKTKQWTIQEKLDMAWKHKGCSVEELSRLLGCLKPSASFYHQMVARGVRESAKLEPGDWEGLDDRIRSGERAHDVALSVGVPPASLKAWMASNRPATKTLTRKLAGAPFSRFGEVLEAHRAEQARNRKRESVQ